ncbi:MAG: methyltransferase domain-containing protein [Pseudomonadota bacterium]
MSVEHEQEYDDALVHLLEAVWGEGYLSPGGPDEILLIVDGVRFDGRKVLDLGCGTGGISLFLAETYKPAHMVGLDVDEGLVDRAASAAEERGLAGVAEFVFAEPGPLPFADASFDIVFSKDAMIHIPDKEALMAEVARVLAPNGTFAACDWMAGSDGPFSDELKHYVELEDLGFGMASAARYERAMTLAGLEDIRMTDRNTWYRERVARECEALSGSLYEGLVDKIGKEFVDHEIDVWNALKVVVDSGELRPTHMRARNAG